MQNIFHFGNLNFGNLSDKTIKPPATSDNSLTPLIDYHGNKIRVKFTGSILRQP